MHIHKQAMARYHQRVVIVDVEIDVSVAVAMGQQCLDDSGHSCQDCSVTIDSLYTLGDLLATRTETG